MEQAPDYVLGLAGVPSLDAKGALDAPPGEPTQTPECLPKLTTGRSG
jgi:hypothetical protein